jgi:hypothetical protein
MLDFSVIRCASDSRLVPVSLRLQKGTNGALSGPCQKARPAGTCVMA